MDARFVVQLRKEADENIDVVAAYTLQIKEVFDSYVGRLHPQSLFKH